MTKTAERHRCPSCGASITVDGVGSPLRCLQCDWRLISREEWQKLPPFEQGFLLYMQSSWPTSPLKNQKNPHAKGTRAWTEFCDGETRAARAAQDGEE